MTKRMIIMLIIVGVIFGGIFGFKGFQSYMMKKYMSAGCCPGSHGIGCRCRHG